jgi:hypothetical protein
MVIAAMSLFCTNANAAPVLHFSFSDGAGTVTGDIYGLTDNALSSASEVLITSIPAVFAPLAEPDATQWATQLANIFDFDFDTNVCTTCVFQALESFPPAGPALFIGPTHATFWSGGPLTGEITFTAIPEPSTSVLFLTAMLGVAIVKRRRRADGLNDPDTRMRS